MANSVRALINPELLKWARESAAITVSLAAEKIKTKPDVLEDWENGKAQPTFKQLLTISHVYKRPLSLFYLSRIPNDFMPLRDYRRLPEVPSPFNESPQLNLEIRKAYYRRQIAIELMTMLEESFPNLQYRIDINKSPEILGEKLRQLLDISIEEQISWKTDYEALNEWRKKLENLGVLVFQSEKIEVTEMRGFTIADRPLPVIVVNKKDTPRGRIFSMLHELVHVLLGESSISGSDQVGYHLTSKEQEVEVFCNFVAATTLLPQSAFQTDEMLASYENRNEWNDDMVMEVAKRFNVSRECIWRRLLTRKKITIDAYQQKRNELLKDFFAHREKQKQAEGGPQYHVKVLSSIGTFYTELVLNSYYREKITSNTLSEYLGVKLKHISTIENALFGAAR